MNTNEAAKIIGTTPKSLRAYLRRVAYGVGMGGGQYTFTHEQVAEIGAAYWDATPKRRRHAARGFDAVEDHPGLPMTYLQTREGRAKLNTEGRERIRRLNELLRARGMDVPSMTEDALVRTGRALNVHDGTN